MDPLTIGIIAAGAGQGLAAIVNYYNAEKARKADAAKLAEIRQLYERIKPPDYDLSIDDPPKLHSETLALPQFRQASFDMTKLQPAELKLIGQLSPTLAPYIEERAPQLIQRSADAETGRQAQLDALRRYMQTAKPGGIDPAMAQAQEMARRKTQIEAQSREQSIGQDWQRRGLMGAGLGMAQQMQAGASGMDRLALENMEAAKQAYQARLQAMAAGAQLGGQIQNQDLDLAQQNAQIINAFNQRMAAGRQAWEQQRAGDLTAAEKFNLGIGQEVANKNWGAQNQFMLDQQSRADALNKYLLNRSDDIAKYQYQAGLGERDYQNRLATIQAAWRDNEKQQKNKLLSQGYQDQITQAAGMSGAIGGQAAGARQAAQDQAQFYQGLGNIFGSGVMGWGQSQQAAQQTQADQAREDERRKRDQEFWASQANYERGGGWKLPEGYK